jgi:hypothetical protein
MALRDVAPEVRALYENISTALAATDERGRKFGDARCGVYCFYDFDGEPIYVGQTREKLRTRVRRHLTNQRTDAVAMFVLDPYEVHSLKLWPFWDLETLGEAQAKEHLDRAEWTVYAHAVKASRFGAVLNEGLIVERKKIALPKPLEAEISPAAWNERNLHPDVRLVRRAQTMWLLAKVASERDVSLGLRRTLVVQARRLLHLAEARVQGLMGTDTEETDE